MRFLPSDRVDSIYARVEVRAIEMDLGNLGRGFDLVRSELGSQLMVLDDRSLTLAEAGLQGGTLLRVRMDD